MTPGPWELRPAMGRDALVLGSVATEQGFAIFEQFDGEPSAGEVQANAKACVAVPDMIAALKSVPIPGRTEPAGTFYARMDTWLINTYNPAMRKAGVL